MKQAILAALIWLPVMGVYGAGAAATDVDTIKKWADAQVSIERLRKQSTPNWRTIADRYEVIAPLVVLTDRAGKTTYDPEIRTALDQCARGEKTKVNQQVLAKGLQHVVVLNIIHEMKKMTDSQSVKRIAAYFEGIRPTFKRRDKDFFSGRKTLEAAAENAISNLLKPRESGSLTPRRELADAIDRTYALCVLYEILQVEKRCHTDPGKCEVKVKEAEIFYRIIRPRIMRHSPAADRAITRILGSDYKNMSAADLEKHLNRGLAGLTLR